MINACSFGDHHSIVLVIYDFLLSLDREARYIWRRGFSSATVLYFLLRYGSLSAVIITMLNLLPYDGKSSDVRDRQLFTMFLADHVL